MTTTLPAVPTLRQSDLGQLAAALQDIRMRSFDVTVRGSDLQLIGSTFDLTGLPVVTTDDGVLDINGLYTPTDIANEGIASKLDIQLSYLRRCFTQRPDLYEANVGGWLSPEDGIVSPYSDKTYLLRLMRADDSPTGILRAFLSANYKRMDNIDVLYAALQGIKEAGIVDPIIEADLTERRMVVKVTCPQIAVYAEELLKNYRSPFDDTDVSNGWTPDRLRSVSRREGQEIEGGGKVVFAGFVISNSEIGGGAFSITPRIVVQVCNNGLTFRAEREARTHLGAKLDDGIVRWSSDTEEANMAVIAKQVRDTVATFVDAEYVTAKVRQLEAAGKEKVSDAPAVITAVSKKLAFPEALQADLLRHFYKGGDDTAFGVVQAMTSVAQVVRNADLAFDMERDTLDTLRLVSEANRLVAAGK